MAAPLTSVNNLPLGPSMEEFMSSCFAASPPRFLFIWITGVMAMTVTLCISWEHSREIAKRPPSIQKIYYNRVSWFPPVLAVAAAVCLFSPRVFLLMKMFQQQAEAIALQAFGGVLFILCASVANDHFKETDKDSYSSAFKMLAALNEGGPSPHFAVPPFACCFVRCMRAHLLKPWHLRFAVNLIRQYAFVVVIGSLVCMWSALANDLYKTLRVLRITGYVTKLSGFVCIYGLFIMYKATHKLLEAWKPTAKFVSLKLVVLLMAYQEFMIKKIVATFPAISGTCLADASNHWFPAEEVQNSHREHFMSMYLIVIESIVVATLVRRAFPASELCLPSMEANAQVLEIDLARLEESWREDEEESESDEASDEGEDNGETGRV